MVKKLSFVPILGSLEKLSDKERVEYVSRLCTHLGIPDDLGLIELSWQDSGDGARSLAAYIRKGGTEIIRANNGIDIDEMIPCHGPDYVAFSCKAHDKTGRHEIAVGAVSTKGLTGSKVAEAVMWSQTRASRRVTLQFVGGGVHDESEMPEKTTNIAYATQPLQEIAQPSVKINSEGGKDITSLPKEEPSNNAVTATAHLAEGSSKEESKKRHHKRGITDRKSVV